jgi:hypothetical protein
VTEPYIPLDEVPPAVPPEAPAPVSAVPDPPVTGGISAELHGFLTHVRDAVNHLLSISSPN